MLFTVNDSRHSWIIMFLLREWEINTREKIPGSSWVQSSLEGVRISWSLAEACRQAAYIACLLLLCQGSKWLNGKTVWLVFIPAGSRIFFPWIYFSLSQQRHHYSRKVKEGHATMWKLVRGSVPDWLLRVWPFQKVTVHCIHVTTLTNWYHLPHTVRLILKHDITPWKLDAQKESMCANRWSRSIHPPSSSVVSCSVKVAGK